MGSVSVQIMGSFLDAWSRIHHRPIAQPSLRPPANMSRAHGVTVVLNLKLLLAWVQCTVRGTEHILDWFVLVKSLQWPCGDSLSLLNQSQHFVFAILSLTLAGAAWLLWWPSFAEVMGECTEGNWGKGGWGLRRTLHVTLFLLIVFLWGDGGLCQRSREHFSNQHQQLREGDLGLGN